MVNSLGVAVQGPRLTLREPAHPGMGIKKVCLRKAGRFRPASEVASPRKIPTPAPQLVPHDPRKGEVYNRPQHKQRAPRIPLAGFRNLTTSDRGMSTLFEP